MSTFTTPPDDGAGSIGGSDPRGDTDHVPAGRTRRGSKPAKPEADLELMLALRGAAHARDLRNRVVRPQSAETRHVGEPGEPAAAASAAADVTGPAAEDDDTPRDLAHPN